MEGENMDLRDMLPVEVDDQAPIEELVKLMNYMKDIQHLWKNDAAVTVKGPDGKLVRHQIMDYGALSHREVLSYLDKPTPEALQQFEDERQKRLDRFNPLKQKWVEMDNFSKLFASQVENGPNVLYVLGQVQDVRQTSSYIDLYGRKLKEKEQMIIYLGVNTGPTTYMDARDFLSSDIIDNSMPKEQCRRVLEEFANGDFQMLFISYDLRHEDHGGLGPTFFHKVRAVIIEELGNNSVDIEFKSFLESCSVAYHSNLPLVHVITVVRPKSASWMKDALQSYMREAYLELAKLVFHRHLESETTPGDLMAAFLRDRDAVTEKRSEDQ